MTTTKKITKATFRSFIRKNSDRLFVKERSRFDGMIDCVADVADTFQPAETGCGYDDNTMGIRGVWLVRGRNWFVPFEENGFSGFTVYNCCGSFIVAVRA